MMGSRSKSGKIQKILESLSVARVIFTIFLFLIIVGSSAIYFSEGGNISYVDSLYLSASAVCVTGLSPLNLSDLGHLTHWIIMILIQLGGLGIITFTVIIGLLVIRGGSRNERFNSIVKEAIDATQEDQVVHTFKSREVLRILFSVVNISLTIEIIGALFIYFYFPGQIPDNVDRWFLSLFTSISAFNNAGFSIIDDLSIIAYDPGSIFIVSTLVILGGIGFPVIIYVEKVILNSIQKLFYHLESRLETYFYNRIIMNPDKDDFPLFYEFFIRISHYLDSIAEDYNSHLHGESNRVQYKILFYGTGLLLFLGTVSVYYFESNNPQTLYGMDWVDKLANAFFVSVCSRTAGFATIDFTGIQDATVVIVGVLMFIGGGPQGTAGGVKITTFAILTIYLMNVIRPTERVKIFGETISKNSVAVSIRVYFLATTFLAVIFLILTILNQSDSNLHAIFFEMVSAFSTVGFSLGLTPLLSDIEKIVYSLLMLVGRIGIFTSLIALTGHSGSPPIGEDDGVKIQVG